MQSSLDLSAPLTLVTLAPAFGMRNVSPFCLKSELLLTQLEIPFELEEEADPRKAPKGKLPFLRVGSVPLADSELIADYLEERTSGQVFGHLSEAQQGRGWAATRLAEEHLYWIMVASRWLDDDWWPNVVEGFFSVVPGFARGLVARAARKETEKTYRMHGLGRHSIEEQRGFAHRDLAALNGSISGQGFLLGDTPNYFDFAVAGVLSGIYDNQPATWLTTLAGDYPDLRAYADRVQSHVGIFGRTR